MAQLIISPRPTLSKLNTVEGVKAGETAKVRLSNGPRYEEIKLVTNYDIAASDTRIRLSLTADEIYNVKAKDLAMIQRFRKLPVTANALVIPFADASLLHRADQRHTALDTGQFDNNILEIDIPASVDSPTMKGRAVTAPMRMMQNNEGQTVPAPRVVRPFLKYHHITATSSGEVQWLTMPKSPTRKIKAIHFLSDAMGELTIKRNTGTIFEATLTENNEYLQRKGFAPQNGVYHFFPLASRLLEDIFHTQASGELEFVLNLTKAPTNGRIEVLTEWYDAEPAA
ncbi:major capsid protein P2 [Vibrio hepatarius]|uniref:major capsid protein P2 n=1 Tax=Vibrio hepatarius TaxID=171383 RepID=UPI003736CFD2